MSQTYEFYAARAEAAAAEAKAAKLANVRKRALLARDSWLGLAAQARKVTRQRARLAAKQVAD